MICLQKCIKTSESLKINLQKPERYSFLIFAFVQILLFFTCLDNFFMNFKLSLKMTCFFILAHWNNALPLHVLLLCKFFVNFIEILLDDVLLLKTEQTSQKDKKMKLIQIQELVNLFHKSFGMQLTCSLCYLILFTVIRVSKIYLSTIH